MIQRAARLVGITVCLPLFAYAQQPTWQAPPKLVVGVVVDQMRVDFIYRFWDNFGEGGFKRLVNEGAFCRDAQYPYSNTDTGPGHASIFTGSLPAYHGIVANDPYDRRLKRIGYCVEDTSAILLGVDERSMGVSPRPMQATTLADELERASSGKAITIGISLKDRGAILPMGRTADAAYWFQDMRNGFVSSNWYMDELPVWIKTFNQQNGAATYMSGIWDLLLPLDRYHSPLPDNNSYESPLPDAAAPVLPVDLDSLAKGKRATTAFINTPGANNILTDLALQAIKAEGLGADAITDMLSISYSATDKLGHRMGPLALELEDMYLRLDLEIARLLKGLDEGVGTGNYTLFLTADHGAPDVPAYRASLGASAGYMDLKAVEEKVGIALRKVYGEGTWVLAVDDEKLFLDRELVRSKGLTIQAVQAIAADAARTVPGMYDVYTAYDLQHAPSSSGPRWLVANGHHPDRGSDLYFVNLPGYIAAYPASPASGTDHGGTWMYDTHVPLIFFGKGIAKGELVKRLEITDIAPTIAMLIGCALPDATVGQAIPEVLK